MLKPITQAALKLADKGLPVFPCGPDKKPACKGGFKAATIDPVLIEELFERPGVKSIGIPCGVSSGIDAIDVDPKNGGLEWLEANRHFLAGARCHHTPSGGYHFLVTADPRVGISQSRLGKGVDVRAGDAGYIIWHPASGLPVINPMADVPWPAELLEKAIGATAAPRERKPVERSTLSTCTIEDSVAVMARTAICEMIAATPAGGRYDACLKKSMRLAGYVNAGKLDEDTTHDMLIAAAEEAGGEDMSLVESLWESALLKAEPEPDAGSEFDALPPEPDEPATSKTTRTPFRDRLLHPADCETGPRRGYLVKGLVAPGDVTAIVGHPGSGKSILAPHLGYAVAQGRSVFGMRTKPGRVLYLAAEDFTGMRQRVHALKLRHGDAPDFALADIGNLRTDESEAADLLAHIKADKPALVVIDTLGAAWAGMEENGSQDMGQVVSLSRAIAATGAAVILVHHTAKQGDGSPRGHSVLNGTLDACIGLTAPDQDEIVRASLSKNRNGTTQTDMAFRIESADLGLDEDSDAITAPIAAELEPNTTKVKRPKLSVTEQGMLKLVSEIGSVQPDGSHVVDEAAFLAECDNRRISPSDNAKSRRDLIRVKRGNLQRLGLLISRGDQIIMPKPKAAVIGTPQPTATMAAEAASMSDMLH